MTEAAGLVAFILICFLAAAVGGTAIVSAVRWNRQLNSSVRSGRSYI